MFPGIYEFRWDLGHLVFLGIFYSVALSLATVVVLALLRTRRDLKAQRAEVIRWHEDFEALPSAARTCRHALEAGGGRTCERGFACDGCERHAEVLATQATTTAARDEAVLETPDDDGAPFGYRMPADRFYHRGHTWARPEEDGTFTVGLDDLAARLLNGARRIDLPQPGDRVHAGGAAWRMRDAAVDVAVRAPLSGTVVALGAADDDFVLRVRPDREEEARRSLLQGPEVRAWMLREVERLQGAVSGSGAVLADGGAPDPEGLVELPSRKRDAVVGEMLLDP